MAFKILTDDEIKLLTDNQRIQYENELTIYNERVKFVEQLEKLESAQIQPYEPKLTYIPVIGSPPEKTFTTPVYDAKITEQVKKVEPKYNAVDFIKPDKTVLPEYSKISNIEIDHVKTIEQVKPTLPEINKATAPVKSFSKAETIIPILPESKKVSVSGITFKKSEQAKPDLPAVTKLQSYEGLVFTPVNIDNSAIMANNPTTITPKITLTQFVSPEKAQPVLPKSMVKFTNIKAFQKPEHAVSHLPKTVVPQQVIAIKQEKISHAKLPEISNISPVAVSFNKPEIKNAQLPHTKLPEISNISVTASFSRPEAKDTQLPHISKIIAPECTFAKSEHNSPALPTVLKPQTVVKAFNVPKHQKYSMPTVIKPTITAPSYKALHKLDKNIPELEYPTVNVIKVKSFKKVTNKVTGLPNIGSIAIPNSNTSQALKNLIFANKNTETTEGAN